MGIWNSESVSDIECAAGAVIKDKGDDIMADFFDSLGQRLSNVASDLGKKTEDTLEVQKIKSDIRGLKRANDRDFRDIGLMIYERYEKGEEIDESYREICESISKREDDIERQEEEIVRIKGV